MATFPLTGELLLALNNLPGIPIERPLGDQLNDIYNGALNVTLIGDILKAYNNLPAIPENEPLGDLLNTLAGQCNTPFIIGQTLPGSTTSWSLRQYESNLDITLNGFDPAFPLVNIDPNCPPLLIHMMTTMMNFNQVEYDALDAQMTRAASLSVDAYPAYRLLGLINNPLVYVDAAHWANLAVSLDRLCDLRPPGEFRVGLDREAYAPGPDILLDAAGLSFLGITRAQMVTAMAPFLQVMRDRQVYPVTYPYESEDALIDILLEEPFYSEVWTEYSFNTNEEARRYFRASEYLSDVQKWQQERSKAFQKQPKAAFRCFFYDDSVRLWGRELREEKTNDWGPFAPGVFDANRIGTDEQQMWTVPWFNGITVDSRNEMSRYSQFFGGGEDSIQGVLPLADSLRSWILGPGFPASLTIYNGGVPSDLAAGTITLTSASRHLYRVFDFTTMPDFTIGFTASVDFELSDPNTTEKKVAGAFLGGVASGAGGSWYFSLVWTGSQHDLVFRHLNGVWITTPLISNYTPGTEYRYVVRFTGTTLTADVLDMGGAGVSTGPLTGNNTYAAFCFGNLQVDGAGDTEPGIVTFRRAVFQATRAWSDAEVALERPDLFWPYQMES